ncbi:hypothetical protein AB1Y20_014999 [Prymnesium parvum]|uniref:Glucokinase n=1 Tax=Prymnesium parvum TaxID=97485 RepID=A0AB34JWI7_PRYPA
MASILLGDVGGSNIRLALVPASELGHARLPKTRQTTRYRTSDFAHLRDALRRFTAESGAVIASCALCVCGPVREGRAVCLAESMGDGWVLEEADLAAALGAQSPCVVRLLNDFVAVGLAVGLAVGREGEEGRGCGGEGSAARVEVHAGRPSAGGTIAVLGPGTGLGACFGVWLGQAELRILPSEVGESDFVARTEDEWALRAHLSRVLRVDHVKVEHVVSGSGLYRIYNFVRHRRVSARGDGAAGAEDDGGAVEALVRAAGDPSAAVAAHAGGGSLPADADCVAALDMFVDALGSEAANLALRFQAHGGVYIAGGVTAKLAPLLMRGTRLQAAYLSKSRSTEAYRECPLYLIIAEGDDLAMEGTWQFSSGYHKSLDK